MSRSALLMWATVLLLGPSPDACAADNSWAGLPFARSSARRATIYTPAYAPAYDGIYTPAYTPPLTRTYVPAYVRTNSVKRSSTVVYPEPAKEAEDEKPHPEIRPAPPVATEGKPPLEPLEQTTYRPVQGTSSATIILNVSGTATVWINGRKTTSQGTHRTYTSVGLQNGFGYRYRIVVQDGDQRTESEVVLTAGETKLVR